MKKTIKFKPDSKGPTHVDWLIENRAATQRTSAKLYRLLKEHPDEIDNNAPAIQMLVAVSFSLWRSAFLSDKTGTSKETSAGAVDFLSEMLVNNAIAYTQERNTKDWTFNYYVGNALYRLKDLADRWPRSKLGPLRPPVGKQTPKNRWKVLQEAFAKAVDHFEKLLTK
jgi:hypothetical protein